MATPQQTPLPACLDYSTADEVAEVLPYHNYLTKEAADQLYSKLWRLWEEAENPTPAGGDGTNGTVECPEDRLDAENDDKAPHWWAQLTPQEQQAVTKAAHEEWGWLDDPSERRLG